MQNIIIEEPYVPVLPRSGKLGPSIFSPFLPGLLRKSWGIEKCEFVHLNRLRDSLRAGHGIVLMPNHCRDEDGLVVGLISCELRHWFYYMASRHVFKKSRMHAFVLSHLGVYSVNREGADRASVKTSVDLLAQANRPLVIFPEGFIGRTNDRLNALMDGPALIARAAAKKRAKQNPPGKVVVHPIALRYKLLAPLEPGVSGVLSEIEGRLRMPSGAGKPVRERIEAIGMILLANEEVKYLGAPQTGELAVRLRQLIEAVIGPLEDEWIGARHTGEPVQARVRRLRLQIVPALENSGLLEDERKRRWQHLARIYLAQQIDNYPPDYLVGSPSDERLLETIERFEEDMTDKLRPFVPLGATVTIGEAIPVNPGREPHHADDPLLKAVEAQLRQMLGLHHQ